MSHEIVPEVVTHIADALRRASRVLFVTGAGLSADSGLPTYRGVCGLYDRETTEDGMPIEVALSGGMLRARPDVCWKYIHPIAQACRGATFNEARATIAKIEARIRETWVLAQNVDGFYRAAGSRDVIEIHGNVQDLTCTECDHRETVTTYDGMEIPRSAPTAARSSGPRSCSSAKRSPCTRSPRWSVSSSAASTSSSPSARRACFRTSRRPPSSRSARARSPSRSTRARARCRRSWTVASPRARSRRCKPSGAFGGG